MLNIGKPFYLEGIGTITKNKTGKFDFSPGEYTVIKEIGDSHDHGKERSQSKDKKTVSLPVTCAGQKHSENPGIYRCAGHCMAWRMVYVQKK